jgi:hypothetical protein
LEAVRPRQRVLGDREEDRTAVAQSVDFRDPHSKPPPNDGFMRGLPRPGQSPESPRSACARAGFLYRDRRRTWRRRRRRSGLERRRQPWSGWGEPRTRRRSGGERGSARREQRRLRVSHVGRSGEPNRTFVRHRARLARRRAASTDSRKPRPAPLRPAQDPPVDAIERHSAQPSAFARSRVFSAVTLRGLAWPQRERT